MSSLNEADSYVPASLAQYVQDAIDRLHEQQRSFESLLAEGEGRLLRSDTSVSSDATPADMEEPDLTEPCHDSDDDEDSYGYAVELEDDEFLLHDDDALKQEILGIYQHQVQQDKLLQTPPTQPKQRIVAFDIEMPAQKSRPSDRCSFLIDLSAGRHNGALVTSLYDHEDDEEDFYALPRRPKTPFVAACEIVISETSKVVVNLLNVIGSALSSHDE